MERGTQGGYSSIGRKKTELNGRQKLRALKEASMRLDLGKKLSIFDSTSQQQNAVQIKQHR